MPDLSKKIPAIAGPIAETGARRAFEQFAGLVADQLATFKAQFDNHTHQHGTADNGFTSKPATDAPGKTGGARSAFTVSILK